MPLYMDFHKIDKVTIDDVKKAHMADKAIQDQFGVKYLQFWVNTDAGSVFCLTEGPDEQTCEKVHQLAHGNIACALTEVEPGFLKLLMGQQQVDHGLVKNQDGTVDLGYRNILLAIVRTTGIGRSFSTPSWIGDIVSNSISKFRGREGQWQNDNMIGVFNEGSDAVECAHFLRRQFLDSRQAVTFRIGLSAEQPVTQEGDFFSKAIRLARRLADTADDNQIMASSLVKRLCKNPLPEVTFLENGDEQFINSLLDATDKNLGDSTLTVRKLCQQVGISQPQFYRKMTSLTGRAPNAFLRDIRMERALPLLKQKSRNVSQVALEVGYSNPSYFSRCFFEKFGCKPSDL